jgi:hypothetical protein
MKDKTTLKSSISVLAIICIGYNFLLIVNRALPFIFKELDENPLLIYFRSACVLFLAIIWLALAIAAIIYFFFQLRRNPQKAVLPFLINVFTALILYGVPPLFEVVKFKLNKSNYDEVIKMVDEGHFQPNYEGIADLPPRYRYLSQTGCIFIYKRDNVKSVFFWKSIEYRLPVGSTTELISFSGYMYRSNDTPPPSDYMLLNNNFVYIDRKTKNWFFCRHLAPKYSRPSNSGIRGIVANFLFFLLYGQNL